MSELKNCPFCGGEAKIVGGPEDWSPTFHDPDSGGDPVAVVCQGCNCGLHFFEDYADAITAWNRRADHWIPASNPPKTSSDYLVETGSKRPFSAFYAEVANMWVKGDENIHPTHWMPLPAPPEGVEQG